ncbi:MAG: DUF3347 domain-containing protein, partial [Planctomycetes bacterium]|nr:DUF3347 domain-containing protein [Planctomycetota bacterium]
MMSSVPARAVVSGFTLVMALLAGAPANADPGAPPEARMKDYVCGKAVPIKGAVTRQTPDGVTLFFCGEADAKTFDAGVEKYVQAAYADYGAWVDHVYTHYFALRTALAWDVTAGVREEATAVGAWAGAAVRLEPPLEEKRLRIYQGRLTAVAMAARAFTAGQYGCPLHPDARKRDPGKCPTCSAELSLRTVELGAAREAFKGLSLALAEYTRDFEFAAAPAAAGAAAPPAAPAARTLHLFRCNMARGVWLQEQPELANPYFGAKMRDCGERVEWSDPQAIPAWAGAGGGACPTGAGGGASGGGA